MDPTNANTALASAFAEELARGGLRLAAISPGSRSTPLALALWRQPEIEVSVIVDERSAGFFALGAAQASRKPVALLCTSGTALVNYHPAVIEADESGVPLLVLSADRPPELRGTGAGQTIDQIKTFGASVRWFFEVGTHEADDDGLLHYRSIACRALAKARGEVRPGPVHLNLPWREPLAPVPVEGAVTATDPLALEGRGERLLTAVTPPEAAPSRFLVDEVAGHIAHAKSGVIVAGRQFDPGLREPLARLAKAAGMPILADPTSQLRCGPHDRSHVVAAYDLLLRDEGFAGSATPDLVLRFGEMPTSKPLRAWLTAGGADQLIVDPYGGWNEPTNRAAAILRADPVELASGWAGRLEHEERPAPQAWIDAEAAAQAALDEAFASSETISEPGLHRALGEAHGDGDLVYVSSSMPIRDQEAFLAASSTDALFLSNRGANGIDGLISSGIGAARASGRPTTIVSGDLGFLHDLGGLAALREVSTPVRILVIDNDGGGIFHFLPQREAMDDAEFDRLLATPRGIDAAKAADLFG
ncbi:MAG: 2-succinyl-5-enolpyruvyl-6-hydroxy-3-cyclohexene-1-carboxylic-acid synthase, partial [Actinomycetota bacterium]|nr:2-succinyl-5-enolpyruvyl-6-hydroxy-3-cyclohexene-1-carboxylic-acid synthase [Actinomycetota bacterium]